VLDGKRAGQCPLSTRHVLPVVNHWVRHIFKSAEAMLMRFSLVEQILWRVNFYLRDFA
jgi:hypothetical protein